MISIKKCTFVVVGLKKQECGLLRARPSNGRIRDRMDGGWWSP
jgi:hypothetical protein